MNKVLEGMTNLVPGDQITHEDFYGQRGRIESLFDLKSTYGTLFVGNAPHQFRDTDFYRRIPLGVGWIKLWPSEPCQEGDCWWSNGRGFPPVAELGDGYEVRKGNWGKTQNQIEGDGDLPDGCSIWRLTKGKRRWPQSHFADPSPLP